MLRHHHDDYDSSPFIHDSITNHSRLGACLGTITTSAMTTLRNPIVNHNHRHPPSQETTRQKQHDHLNYPPANDNLRRVEAIHSRWDKWGDSRRERHQKPICLRDGVKKIASLLNYHQSQQTSSSSSSSLRMRLNLTVRLTLYSC